MGYMGHLCAMCGVICELSHCIPECGARLLSTNGWSEIVLPSVDAVLRVHKEPLGDGVSAQERGLASASDVQDEADSEFLNETVLLKDILSEDEARAMLGAAPLGEPFANDASHDSSGQNDICGDACGNDGSPGALSSIAECVNSPTTNGLLCEHCPQQADAVSFWDADFDSLLLNSAEVSGESHALLVGVDDVTEALESLTSPTNFRLQEETSDTTCVSREPMINNEDLLDIFGECHDAVGASGPAEVTEQNAIESPVVMSLKASADVFLGDFASQSNSSLTVLSDLISTNTSDVSGQQDNKSRLLPVDIAGEQLCVDGDAWASFQAYGVCDTDEGVSKTEISLQMTAANPEPLGLGVTACDLFHAFQPESPAKSATSGLEHSWFVDFDPLLQPVTAAESKTGQEAKSKSNGVADGLSDLIRLWPCE